MLVREVDFPWDGNYTAYSLREILLGGIDSYVAISDEIISMRTHHGLLAVAGVYTRLGVAPYELWVCFCREFSQNLRGNMREANSLVNYLLTKYGRLEAHVEKEHRSGHSLMRFCGWTPLVGIDYGDGRNFIKYGVSL